ncbi:MAG: glutaminyl-peptide cyclotransferase [candidate division Zixibacteria bacterium]|nr:glutaminyl-peptide cyclotransferase [candidate division Zixibacteria bacterium]
MTLTIILAINCLVSVSCSDSSESKKPPIPSFTYGIVNIYPHSADAFTQGLTIYDGILYEGTGQYGKSALRVVNLETGEIIEERRLPDSLFGEGIAVYNDKIVQLTWQSNTGFVYDRETLELIRQFSYPTEGWGITYDYDRDQLIMSDGRSCLYFLDPETFEQIDKVKVIADGSDVYGLNELEYINGEIFANLWPSFRAARIDPLTGEVTGWIYLSGLASHARGSGEQDVLNGIAYDRDANRLFVTGKLWNKIFEIELIRVEK